MKNRLSPPAVRSLSAALLALIGPFPLLAAPQDGALTASPPPPLDSGRFRVDGVVRECDTTLARATIADADGRRFIVDYLDASLSDATGQIIPARRAWLRRGMRVIATGTRLPRSVVVADQVTILSGGPGVVAAAAAVTPPAAKPDEDRIVLRPDLRPFPRTPVFYGPTLPVTPAATDSDPDEGAMPEAALTEPAAPIRSASAVTPASPDYAATLAELDTFTGILIDARHLPEISRSPAPALYGPAPALALLYPDRAHVPTPDEVQEQSIVRYYHTTLAARKGVAGDNPLILPARAVRGFAQDSLELSASDRALLAALDKKLGFSRTWRVGFLVPASR